MLLAGGLVVGTCPSRRSRGRAAPLAAQAPAAGRPSACLSAYTGMCSAASLELGSPESRTASGFEALPQNGCQWTAMRHGKRVPRLERPADQRKALIRGLVTQVISRGSITTTKPKAKAIRKYVDKMIGLAKQGTLHARRQALAFIYDEKLVGLLFTNAPARYAERNGGYCSVTAVTYTRRGDNAQMAKISLVD